MPWMTVPIALAITGGATAAGQIYATKKAGGYNEQALRAQEREAEQARTLEREQLAAAERARQEALDLEKQRWADYVRIYEPAAQASQQLLRGLYEYAGGAQAPLAAPPSPAALGRTPPPSNLSLSAMATGSRGTPVAGAPQPTRPTFQPPAMPTSTGSSPFRSLMELANLAAYARGGSPAPGMGDALPGLAGLA